MTTYFSKTKALALAAVFALAVAFGLAIATSTAAQADEGDLQAADIAPTVTVAPLADHGTAEDPILVDTPKEPAAYGLTVTETTVENAYTVAFTGVGLEKHYNGRHNEGYWAGIAISGISGMKIAVGAGNYAATEAQFVNDAAGTDNIRVDGTLTTTGGYDDIWFNLGKASTRNTAYVAVANAGDVDAGGKLDAGKKAAKVYTLDFTQMKLAYGITAADTVNGAINVVKKATEGANVAVQVDPADDYELATLTYTNAEGEEVDIKAAKSFEMPSANTTVKATFSKMPKVTFVDWDDKVLKEATPYAKGTPAADIVQPKTPTKPSDASYAYEFDGWDPELADVAGDATYKATYKKIPLYQVTFVDEDGKTVLKEATAYPVGTKAEDIVQPETPTKPAEPTATFEFAGWSPELADVTKTVTYTATYKRIPIPATDPERLKGDTALDTMASIVKEGWSQVGGAIVLTTVDGYWDALTAAGIAGMVKAPVLMTDGSSLSAQTKAVIQTLKPTIIIVCGGSAAVSDEAVDQARDASGMKPLIVRCWGQTATETAIDVFKKGATEQFGFWSSSAFICTNDGYWDALAAAPISYNKQMPIFLTEGSSDISDETIAAMKAGGIEVVYIVGGTAAINESVQQKIEAAGLRVAKRLWGDTAVETSEAVASFGLDNEMLCAKMGVATVGGYWDALAGAPFCGLNQSVIVLARDANSKSISDFIASHKDDVATCYIFGGEEAIDVATYNAIKNALR